MEIERSYSMVDQHYTLWVKSKCPFCVKAKDELLDNIKSFTLHVMDEREEELLEAKKLWNHNTVPIVVLQDGDEEIFIGGYTELKAHLNEEGAQSAGV